MSKLDNIDHLIYPTEYVGWIDHEDFCDKIQYHMAMEGVQMSDATYASLWDDVERNNLKNRKRRLTEEEKYIVRSRRNELEAVNE